MREESYRLANVLAAIAFLLLVQTASARAQADGATPSPAPVATPSDPCSSLISIVNRPSFGTGVCTVRPNHVDLENGYTNLVTDGGANTITYPQSLLRFGTFDPHLDFEVGPISENRSSSDGVGFGGMSDLSFGAKYELGYSAKALWGVNASFTVPTGTPAFGSGNATFTGNFNWGYTLNSEFSMSGTLGFNALSGYNTGGVPQSYFAFTPTVALTAALPGGPSQISAEYAYFSSAGPNLGSKSFVDVFYQRDFGQHVQIDVEYGFQPSYVPGTRQHYVGAGISFMN
ncbi:MAG TPA: transporter [Candidatus Tumulicola sp.]